MQKLVLLGHNTSRRRTNTRRSGAARTGLALALAVMLVLALVAGALAASVAPVHLTGASNQGKTCSDVLPGSTELKVEPVGGGTYTRSDGTLAITIVKPSTTPGSTNSFDWTANAYVAGVVVKDGVDGANWYDYRSLGGSKGDTYLTTPNDGAKGISHISFCYFPPEYEPLTASKTAAGSFSRDITWELTKSVTPSEHSGYAGETAGSST